MNAHPAMILAGNTAHRARVSAPHKAATRDETTEPPAIRSATIDARLTHESYNFARSTALGATLLEAECGSGERVAVLTLVARYVALFGVDAGYEAKWWRLLG
jgi:hypothetical protein